MDYLAEVYLNYQTIHIEELIGPKGKNQKNMADLPPSQVYEYACEDADITLKLKNVFEPKLKEEGCYDLFREVEMPLMPVLAWMERNGVHRHRGVEGNFYALHQRNEPFGRRDTRLGR